MSDITLQMVEIFPTLISSSSTSAPAQFRQVFAYERSISNTLRDATTSSGSCRDFVKEVVDGEDRYRVTHEGFNKIAFYSVFSVSKSPAPPSPVTETVTESSGSRRISGNNNSNNNSSSNSNNINDTTHSTTSPSAVNNLPANFYTGDDIQYPSASRPAVGEKRKVSPVNIVANLSNAKRNRNHSIYQQCDTNDDNDNDEVEEENSSGNKMDIVDDENSKRKKSEMSRELLSLTDNGLNDLIIPSQLYGASKPVEQRDLKTGRFIRCYVSLTAAAAASGICRKKIASCCSGLDNTTPFKWVYRKLSDRSRKDTGIITSRSTSILP